MWRRALRISLAGIAAIGLLGACGAVTPATTTTPTPSPTASAPTPTATAAPLPPLVVTVRDVGPPISPWTQVQLSLVGEDGTVAGTFLDPGGVDGDAYAIGSGDVYFIDGTAVKALGPDGTVTDAGVVPPVNTTVDADDLQSFTAFAVSPDDSTFIFGIPLAIQGDHGATSDHSQLWTEPVGGTAAEATMVYDDTNGDDQVVQPRWWGSAGILVSNLSTTGLGGAGPFLSYTDFDAALFDPATHVLTSVQGDCLPTNPQPAEASAPVQVCESVPTDPNLTVDIGSEQVMVTMQVAGATSFGSVVVSDDARYLAYGAYIGTSGSGHYVTTVVDLSNGATVSSVSGDTPTQWLADDRLVVSPSFLGGATYLLSPSFDNPVKLSTDQATGALP
jgi:hypothetical protein